MIISPLFETLFYLISPVIVGKQGNKVGCCWTLATEVVLLGKIR